MRTANEITTSEVFNFMKEHNLKELPIFTEKGDYVGHLKSNGAYQRDRYAARYIDGANADAYAMDLAVKNFPTTKELYDLWNKETELTAVYYSDYKPAREEIRKGTLDSIFNEIDRANNRLRYCNGSYFRFKDERYKTLYNYWNFHISAARSFDNFYQGGIVD